MKNKTNKTSTIIAHALLVLLLTNVAAFITCLPVVNAAEKETYPFISLVPNPIGVNQTLHVTVWVQPVPITREDLWKGYKVTFTKPDGTTEIIEIAQSDYSGIAWFNYMPQDVGTWKVQFSFPGQTISTGDYYKPSRAQ